MTKTVTVPSVLDQKLFGTPITYGTKLSKAELRTLFYVGRKLELIACLVPMAAPQGRVVKEHKSFGYIMEREDGKQSRLDFETGQIIMGISSAGNGYTEVKITDADGQVAAHYRLL